MSTVFATLFSAIVTAFVIETSQNLQPDSAAISANTLIEIAGTLRYLANGEQTGLNTSTPFPSLDDFEPTTSQFFVNFVWFVSLCLSITVALLASLVKQWCSSFISDRTSPPCNQARIRQARLEKLIGWRTELIVSALPVIMHTALGLFLCGLVIFLKDLSYPIYVATSLIAICTTVIYIGTTIIPFFVAFCPYETPLSSLKAWGYCYQLCLAVFLYICRWFADIQAEADLKNYMSPCELQEQKTSNNTTPDGVTGHALNWIIMHSRSSKTRNMAIQAIAGLRPESQETLQQLVKAPPGIFPQVVQSFTACFSIGTSDGRETLEFEESIEEISSRGEALTTLVNLAALGSDRNEQGYLANWGVDDDAKEAVKKRFQRLINNTECGHAKVLGLVGLSAWYNFIGHEESRFGNGDLIESLTESLRFHWPSSQNLCTRILHALMVESAYWAPDIEGQRRANILNCLVSLIPEIPNSDLGSRLACSLTVIALGLNRRSTHLALLGESDHSNLEAGYRPPPVLAPRVVEYYTNYPNKIARDEQALMLFALTGLVEHYEHCDFDDGNREAMGIIAKHIATLENLGKQRLITLPNDTGLKFDIGGYFVEILVHYLKQARVPSRSQATDKVFVQLLQSIKNKHQVWEAHASLIIHPIIQILLHTADVELQSECLSAIGTKGGLGQSLVHTRMLLSYGLPFRLVQLVHGLSDQTPEDCRAIISSNVHVIFENISKHVESGKLLISDQNRLVSLLDSVLKADLLSTLLRDILGVHPTRTSDKVWSRRLSGNVALYDETRDYIDSLSPINQDDAQGAREKTILGNDLLIESMFRWHRPQYVNQYVVPYMFQHWKRRTLGDRGGSTQNRETSSLVEDVARNANASSEGGV